VFFDESALSLNTRNTFKITTQPNKQYKHQKETGDKTSRKSTATERW